MEDNQQAEASVRWSVTDPLGNKVILIEEQFIEHIIDAHESKDAINRAMIERQVRKSIAAPRFIIKDQRNVDRRKYLDLVDVSNEAGTQIKTLAIVVDDNNEVVTWILKRNINEFVVEGGMIYDAQMVR